MRLLIAAFALALSSAPFAASAQNMPPDGGPPPQVRAQLEQARANAKTASFNALNPDHRTQVQAIADRVAAGSLDRQTAATQIDAMLTPAETQAVLAQAQNLHNAMRQAFAQSGMPAAPSPNANGAHGPHQHRTPDAGRFLLMVSLPMRHM